MTLHADMPGERLDAFLARCAEGLTRSAAQKLSECVSSKGIGNEASTTQPLKNTQSKPREKGISSAGMTTSSPAVKNVIPKGASKSVKTASAKHQKQAQTRDGAQ